MFLHSVWSFIAMVSVSAYSPTSSGVVSVCGHNPTCVARTVGVTFTGAEGVRIVNRTLTVVGSCKTGFAAWGGVKDSEHPLLRDAG